MVFTNLTFKRGLINGLSFVMCFFASFNAIANENYVVPNLEGELLSDWLTLSYYNKNKNGYESEIINDEYFVAKNGRVSPVEEYAAFVKVMHDHVNKSNKASEILCKFPARVTLLEKHISWFKGKRPVCNEYIEQNNPENLQSTSLVFASGYFFWSYVI